MSREIKFRAWDTINYMSSSFTLQDLQDKKIQFIPNLPIMQYTGLKDKNGKEIYEGDIIKCYDFGITAIGIVVYKIDSFQIDWIKNATGFNNNISVRIDKIEVIGNIFENPELLNKQN